MILQVDFRCPFPRLPVAQQVLWASHWNERRCASTGRERKGMTLLVGGPCKLVETEILNKVETKKQHVNTLIAEYQEPLSSHWRIKSVNNPCIPAIGSMYGICYI